MSEVDWEKATLKEETEELGAQGFRKIISV